MIDYVHGGEFLTVTSSKGAQPYINMSGNQPMIGALTYDHNSQQMKVYDGNSWMTIGGGSATVNLNENAISILKWAEKKMQEEADLNRLAESSPAIKDLVNQMNSSIASYKHKIDMVKTLIREEEKVGTS
jgi:hypothetical protein